MLAVRPALATLVLSAPLLAQSPVLPSGFVAESLGSGWYTPTALCWLDGRRLLVAEKYGRLWYVEDKVRRNVVVDLSAEALNNGDRGLLGMTADPRFDENGWIYLLIVVDPDGDGDDGEQESFSRLVRYTAAYDPSGNLVADPLSRLVLLGATWSTGIPSLHLSHAGGRLAFMDDGSLVLAHGDGAHYDAIDAGGLDPGGFGPGRFGPEQDLGVFRSLELDSLAGKILRLDPATGLGLPDNPFYTGNPDDRASRVWARGLRNPFRFTLVPGTGPRGAMFVCDVGHSSWEELDLAWGGESFGWPCYEGWPAYGLYQGNDPHDYCDAAAGNVLPPWLGWNHTNPGTLGFTGNCVGGACVYTGTSYPAIYRGALFFCDFGQSWMRVATLDPVLNHTAILSFASALSSPLDIARNPVNGDLTYISLGPPARVLNLRYTPSNLPPAAVASATPSWGPSPLTVQLSSAGSLDPEGDTLDYAWDFGDGTSSTEPDVTHVYVGNYTFVATLTVTDDLGNEDSEELVINSANTPPVITAVSAPLDGALYTEGQPIPLACSAVDEEDDAAGTPLQYSWTFSLIHDHHVHPQWAQVSGASASWTPPPHGDGSHALLLDLAVRDSRGLTDTQSFELFDAEAEPLPHVVWVSDTTLRAGTPVTVRAHVDYATPPGSPLATLTFEWGDGTQDVLPDSAHQVDRSATHTYAGLGTYAVRVLAAAGGVEHESDWTIQVERPSPAVAVFAPLLAERVIGWQEQQRIGDAIAALAPAYEVARFEWDRQAELAAWMEAYLDDGLCDELVLLDLAPELVFAGEGEGSLAERWLESGNGLVWTGAPPFKEAIAPDGSTRLLGVRAIDGLLDAAPDLCTAAGWEALRPVARNRLPSLRATDATNALRLDRLGPSWRAGLVFARGSDKDTDAAELRHASGGRYAQFYCRSGPGMEREAVLVEYLRPLLRGRTR